MIRIKDGTYGYSIIEIINDDMLMLNVIENKTKKIIYPDSWYKVKPDIDIKDFKYNIIKNNDIGFFVYYSLKGTGNFNIPKKYIYIFRDKIRGISSYSLNDHIFRVYKNIDGINYYNILYINKYDNDVSNDEIGFIFDNWSDKEIEDIHLKDDSGITYQLSHDKDRDCYYINKIRIQYIGQIASNTNDYGKIKRIEIIGNKFNDFKFYLMYGEHDNKDVFHILSNINDNLCRFNISFDIIDNKENFINIFKEFFKGCNFINIYFDGIDNFIERIYNTFRTFKENKK